jgi:TolB-like protein
MLSTDDLLDTVWAPAVVNPETVGQRVKLLRQALGDDPRAPRYVVGVRGRGYRMDVSVTRTEPDSEISADPLPLPPSRGLRRLFALGIAGFVALLTIAYLTTRALEHRARGVSTTLHRAQADASLGVLPFVDMSPLHDQQYFADGLAEELLNQLAQVPALRVIGRTSSFAFRGRNDDLQKIGEQLNVNHLLEGSVRKDGNRVRIAVQLVDSSNGSYIWSHTYERTLDDVFGIQEDVARAVTKELRVRLDNLPPAVGGTRDFAAFDEFLTGRALLNSNGFASSDSATSHLQKAIALDPSYLDAWVWLIDSYTRSAVGDTEHRASIRADQQRAIARVSELAPESAYAAVARSYGALSNGHLEEAEHLLEVTLKVPQSTRARVRMRYGQFLLSVGRGKAAVDQLVATRDTEPLDVFVRMQLVLALEVNGQLDRADAEAAYLRQLPGSDEVLLRGDRLVRAMGHGDRTAVKAALASNADNPVQQGGLDERSLANLDEPSAALRQLRLNLDDPRTGADIFALTWAMEWAAYLGDPQLALQAARRAAGLGVSFETWAWSIWRPVMKDVRRQPGFKALLKEMGVVDYWRATGDWGDFCKPLGSDDFECT